MKEAAGIVFLLLLGAVSGCREPGPARDSGASSPPQKKQVRVMTVQAVSEPSTVESFGSLAPVSKIDITSSVEGKVNEPIVTEGERVEEGELLIRLENLQLRIREKQAATAVERQRAAYALAEAAYWEGGLQAEARLLSLQQLKIKLKQRKDELEGLQIELANKSSLFELGGISEELYRKAKLSYRSAVTDFENLKLDLQIKQIGLRDRDILARGLPLPKTEAGRTQVLKEINSLTLKAEMDAAEAGLVSAEAEWESLRLLLEELLVRAPARGIAGPRYVEQGERVELGDELMYLFPNDRFHVVFRIQEDSAGFIRKGQEIRVTLPGLEGGPQRGPTGKGREPPGAVLRGVVDIVSPVVDPVSGNVLVKGLVMNDSGELKPGMFARVSVEYGGPELKITVPESCFVNRDENRGQLFIWNTGRVFPLTVQTGEKKNERVEITGGLETGDVVVISPPPGLKEGEQVDAAE